MWDRFQAGGMGGESVSIIIPQLVVQKICVFSKYYRQSYFLLTVNFSFIHISFS